jgi:hypothetical protein
MSIEDNVQVVQYPEPLECLVCDGKIAIHETAIEVRFNIDLILTTKEVRKQMHVRCAESLERLLHQRIIESVKVRPRT